MFTPNGSSSRFLRTSIRGFHYARASSGHHGKSHLGQPAANLPGQLVKWMIFFESGRAKNRDTRANKMEQPEASQ